MENGKNRYEFILGFVGLAVSLSAFKDELSKINIDLGFTQLSLSTYFFAVLIGLLLCLYLYVIENSLRNTRIGNFKIFDYLLKFAYILFVLLIASPILLLLSWLSNKIILAFSRLDKETIKALAGIITFILGILSGAISTWTVHKQIKQKKDKQQEELEYEEIRDLETANKLLSDGYYSQAILETFKVLELHLYKLLQKRDIRVQRHRLLNILDYAFKQELLTKKDLGFINEIRKMRNSAAHLDTTHTQEQAKMAVDFVKKMIKKNS